jgi:UDP-galactopyranose mutase
MQGNRVVIIVGIILHTASAVAAVNHGVMVGEGRERIGDFAFAGQKPCNGAHLHKYTCQHTGPHLPIEYRKVGHTKYYGYHFRIEPVHKLVVATW